LHHPGIATVFDFGESETEDGLPFLVMEYVDGRTLSAILTGGALDPATARDYILQAATALAEAHSRDLVHRDIKPGNLLVTDDGVVKITDFGIARAGDGMALTETGQLIGTPSYISPEQAEGQAATPASDVYALGVVLFECLTGRRPYVADSPVAIALAHVREPIPDLPPEVPEGLAAVTTRALAKDPAERYPDAAALAAALEALAPEQTMVLPVTETATAAPAPDRPASWRRGGVVAVAVLAVIALGVAALLADGDGTKDTPAPGSATPSQSVSPGTVQVDPAAYVGKPVAEVRAALTALGLDSRRVSVDNPGGRTAGTVAALQPTGAVAVGTTITLEVWGAAPEDATDGGGKPEPDKGKGKGNDKGKGKGNR
jgi:serine/threonine-protein kinase